jgi:hypothetical protein
MNSDLFRHTLLGVYAPATLVGSLVFHASSAIRTFFAAVSAQNGGNGGLGASAVMQRSEALLFKCSTDRFIRTAVCNMPVNMASVFYFFAAGGGDGGGCGSHGGGGDVPG